MYAKDFMTKVSEIKTASESESLLKIATYMKEYCCGIIPILDAGKLVGVITDRDIVLRAVTHQENLSLMHAHDVMTTNIFCCTENDTIDEILKQLIYHSISRILVLDENQSLAGIVSISDIARKGIFFRDLNAKVGEVLGQIARFNAYDRSFTKHNKALSQNLTFNDFFINPKNPRRN